MQEAKAVKIVVSSGKRKTSVARAVIKPGSGRVWINGVPVELWPIEMAKIKIMEPLLISEKLRKNVDIVVNVRGGGFMSQADAVRAAIARGLLAYFNSEELKNIFLEYDRYMLSGDPRRTEPEKYMRRSARRRWQKSYR
ncbi:MAG: 30S ribosomal protein S9 [Desulfurococcaceae archaeon]